MRYFIYSLFTLFPIVSVCQKCPVKIQGWQQQSQSKEVDTKVQLQAVGDLDAAAQLDIDNVLSQIDSSGRLLKGKFKLDLNIAKEAKKKKYKSYAWTQDVWEEMNLAQQVYCALWDEYKLGIYDTPEGRKTFLDQLSKAREHIATAKKKAEASFIK
jgi:hypothetical protein